MKPTSLLIAVAASAAALLSSTAGAATTCSVTDISPTASACAGFYSGNLLNGSGSAIAAQTSALAELGFTWNGDWNAVEKISSLSGSHTVDFASLLNGTTYVAIHFGNGRGGPGNATAFYKFDAGTNLDQFTLAYNASSNAVLYSTSAGIPPVPEPETYALMLAGLGLVGWTARRRLGR